MFSSDEESQHDRWIRELIERDADEEKNKAQGEYNDYRNHLKIRNIYPIMLRPCHYEDIKEVIEEGLTYAPPGGMIQLRLHNYQEPFKHPALRTEVLGVTPDGYEKVLCRYEEERVSDEFSNEVFDVPQVFNYIGENFEEYAEPWTVVYLPKIVDTSVYRHHETFRYEGLYLMLPVF